MNKNSKNMNLAERIIACQKTEPFPVIRCFKCHSSRTQPDLTVSMKIAQTL